MELHELDLAINDPRFAAAMTTWLLAAIARAGTATAAPAMVAEG